MQINQKIQKITIFLMAVICSLSFFLPVQASVPTTLTLTNISGDVVRVEISGAADSSIKLSFLPTGASTLTTIVFGTTDNSGNFATSISSGGYGIPASSPVYATINGVQSTTVLWPAYTSSLNLSQTSASLAVGQSIAITASRSLILAANSAPTILATSINGSQITITGLNSGSGNIMLCGPNVGCDSIAVEVGGTGGESQVAFNQNNIVLDVRHSGGVTILGGSHNGYFISSNSNPSVLYASITGKSSEVSLYGYVPGTATLAVCSVDFNTNCANLYVTILGDSVASLSFSQNNISLIPGLVQTVTVSGVSDNSYYISSNSNSGVAAATISGTTVTLVGGSTVASTVITVCSTSINNTCGAINATLSLSSTVPSATVLSFSQNVVSVSTGDTTNVTIAGGDGTGYVISSNSEPEVVTASIANGSNIVALYGNETGSSIVTVCSASSNSICASLYATVNAALPQIFFSQNNVSLTPEGRWIITITGGSENNSIFSNSNPNSVIASIMSGGKSILLVGGTVSGSSVIVVCPSSAYDNQCVNLYAENVAPSSSVSSSAATFTPVAGDLIKASTAAVYYLGTDGKRYVFPNEKTYKTWYPDFSSVKTITDSQLAGYAIGGNVTYKPSSKMVKITTDPKVYAVDAHGTLRWITSESVAQALYGASWAAMVDDVADSFFTNYSIGTPIYSSADFSPSTVNAAAASINSDKNL
jgi:hypothetical protein